MVNQASQRLKRLAPLIMAAWEVRAIKEVEAALAHNTLVLQNSLPEFLIQIANALSTTIDRSRIRIKWDKQESTRIGKKHGKERASNFNYTMDQLIFEYHILRQIIFEVMEEEAPLSSDEREIIICAVEQAVNDAATEFSDTLHDLQEKFTYTLAHDLRNPITAAKLSIELLINKSDPNDGTSKIKSRILNSMERIDLMIHDLLDAGRMRAGKKLEFSLEECDINNILQDCIEESNELYDSRIVLKSPGSVIGCWNENGLRRIVDNLISNALKYSYPQTPIDLELSRNTEGVQISLHNFGLPIPESSMKNLFKQFNRAHNGEGKKGWGLGLTVVKGITEAHDGHVEVESSEELGTTFRIFLPYNNAHKFIPLKNNVDINIYLNV